MNNEFEDLSNNRFSLLEMCKGNDLLETLETTYEYNSTALDYVKNKIKTCKNILKYNESDLVVQEELSNLKYIEFTLKFNGELIYSNILEERKKLHG